MSNVMVEEERRLNWRDYYELCKPKVVGLILFTTVVGMLLAVPQNGVIPWSLVVFGLLGIGMAAAAGAAMNHWVDQKIDAVMERTQNRPLPEGKMESRSALYFSLALGSISMLLLVTQVNVLTAVLTLLSLVGYAVIYTMFLKRTTPQNIVWGGAAGAAPPLLGWTAITGDINTEALLLFMIIFIWTPPHFWALAIRRREEYAKVDVPMLPVTHGVAFTKLHILLYTFMLLVVTLMPFIIHMSGLIYLAGAVSLGIGFIFHAYKLYRSEDDSHAMKVFSYSIFYLSCLFAFLLADHYLRTVIRVLN